MDTNFGSLLTGAPAASGGTDDFGSLLRPKPAPAAQPSTEPSGPAPTSVAEFAKQVFPQAQRVAQRLGVGVEAIIGQWGLETGWGKHVIPGTNNLGNIKDTSGAGVAATDNMNGSRDRYKKFDSLDQFADSHAALLESPRYRGAVGAADPAAYFQGLKAGGYAEDPNYVQSGTAAARMAAQALAGGPAAAPGAPAAPRAGAEPTAPKWADVEAKAEFKAMSPEDQAYTKQAYFEHWVAPHVGADAPALFKQFMTGPEPEQAGVLRTIADGGIKLGQGVIGLGQAVVGVGSLLTGGKAGEGWREMGFDPQRAKDMLGEYLSDSQKSSERKVREAEGFVDTLLTAVDNPRSIFGAVTESVPGMAAGAGVSLGVARSVGANAAMKAAAPLGGLSTTAGAQAGKLAAQKAIEAATGKIIWAGAATEGAQASGQIADEAQAAGREYSDYALPAVAAGVTTAIIGQKAGKLMGDAEAAIAARLAGGGAAGGVRGGIGARVAKSAFSEGILEEMPQSAQEQAMTNLAMGKPVGEGVSGAAAMGALTGAAMGGGMGLAQGHAPHSVQSGDQAGEAPAPVQDAPPVPPPAQDGAPAPQPAPPPQAAPPAADGPVHPDEILAYADARYDELRAARDGESGQALNDAGEMVQVEQPARGLSESEADELRALEQHRGDAASLAEVYGFNQQDTAPPASPPQEVPDLALTEPAPAAPPAGQATFESVDAMPQAQRDQLRAQVEAHFQDEGIDATQAQLVFDPVARQQNPKLAGQVLAYLNDYPGMMLPKETTTNVPESAQVPEESQAPQGAQAAPEAAAPAPSLTEQRAEAIADYKQAAASGDEAAAQAAEARMVEARQAINAQQAEAARQAQAAIDAASRPAPAPKTEAQAKAQREAKKAANPAPTSEKQATEARAAKPQYTAEHQALLEQAMKEGIIRPSTLRGERFRNGLVDAKNGVESSNQETAYREGYAWTKKKLAEAAPAESASPASPAEPVAPAPAAPATPTADSIDAAASEAATSPANDLPEPTQAQKDAGNYKKAYITLHGLDISIENPVGSMRRGVSATGKAWATKMRHHYGYIKGTVGMDKDHIDTFIGPAPESTKVFVVDQVDPATGKADEHKVMLGFKTKREALAAYKSNYAKDWAGGKAITETTVDAFKAWLESGATQQPFAPKTEKEAAARRALPPAPPAPTVKEPSPAQPAAAPAPTAAPAEKPAKSEREAKERRASRAGDPIADFGEKIGGARKDLWTAYKDKMAAAGDVTAEPLSKSWPEPDYQALIDNGADPEAVAFMRAARDAVPRKPSTTYKLTSWAKDVALLRELAFGLASGELAFATVKKLLVTDGRASRGMGEVLGRAELYQTVGHQQSLADVSLSWGAYSLYDGITYDPKRVVWMVSKKAKATMWSNWPTELATGATKEEALANFKAKYAEMDIALPAGKASKEVSFDVLSQSGKKGFWIGKKVGRNHIMLAGPFDTVAEARAHKAANQAELVAKLEKSKEIPQVRRSVNEPRAGEDMRGGQDVTAEMFGETFGFRGVEFGNWVEQGRRQQDLNNAFDALMDMAAVLGIPAKAISLNGELGLAFGARGSGGVEAAKAHYERGNIVINLTKKDGAGSLGHEWWHALDNYFSRARGLRADMMTEALDVSLSSRGSNYHPRDGVRREMIDAFGTVVKTIRETALRARSAKLDAKRSTEYWTTGIEMSARAFESYLISKLQDQNASNDYLANIVDEKTWRAAEALGFGLDESYPYPTAGEFPAVRTAFDRFFEAVETRPTDKGVELFDLGRAGPLVRQDKPARTAMVAKLKSLQARLESGKLTGAEYQLAVSQLIGKPERGSESARGAEQVIERLMQARRTGELDRAAVDLALWTIKQNPAIAEDLGISVLEKSGETAGNYNPIARIVTLFQDAGNVETAVHEIMHHTERMMPEAVQAGIVREWSRAWGKAWKGATAPARAAMNDMLLASAGDKTAQASMLEAFRAGVLNYDEHYPLVNASEFWAVHAADILAARHQARGEWIARAKQWLGELVQRVKGWAGLASDAPVLAGLRAVMNGTGQRVSSAMLLEMAGKVEVGAELNDIENLTKYRARSEFVDRWENDHGQPVFYGPKFDLRPFHEFDVSSDLTENSLQLGQTHMVEPGNRVLSFKIVDKDGAKVGTAILQVDKSGDIVGIHDIEAITKNQGIGTEVVRNIVASTSKEVAVIQIVPGAQKFWDDVGIYGQDKLYNHAAINFTTFSQSPRGRAGRVQEVGGKTGQGRSEDDRGNGTSKRGNESGGDVLNDIPNQRKKVEQSQADLVKEFGTPKFSHIDWWDKSIGTQYHKAAKNPHFKRVFDLAVKRENAISLVTIRAAELAPAFLPRIDDFLSAAKTLFLGRKGSKQQELAGSAIISGTLQGDHVLDGKVWTDDELRAQGLDAQGIMLYHQGRAAIDASLDEVAAAEAFAVLQMLLPRGTRELVLDNPRGAREILNTAIDRKIVLDGFRVRNLMSRDSTGAELTRAKTGLQNAIDAREAMEKVFRQAKLMKEAGYAPLMRFGKHFVSTEEVDPETGKTVINPETGAPNTLYFGRFETEGEATAAFYRQKVQHRGNPAISVKSGPINDQKHKMYAGVSPETLELFAEAVGAKEVMQKFYTVAISERSALKRRLDRKNIEGFSQELPRVLSNFITSNGRFAAQRYYTRDLNQAVKYIPRELGDVQKEAQLLTEYIDNPGDGGGMASAVAFTWFLGGNIASAAVNATQPVMMTLPYLSQWGAPRAAAALTKAAPFAMGRKELTDSALRAALKRASQEGKVDSQEIFHLYSVGIQGVAGGLTNTLGKLPLVGGKVKGASEDVRARLSALGTLWGMPFAMVEGFNRRLTFIAAWDVATSTNQADPYQFAVDAVDATQGIYNKVNRPNWARSSLGRVVFTFTQFRIMNVELIRRMATLGGPGGKKAAVMYLAMLILAAGANGLPYSDDIDDIIDTVGQWLGFNTNMKLKKREWAFQTLGKGFGDFALYGASSSMPFDFGGRLGLGNMFPATGMLKPANEGKRTQEFLEIGGPAIGGIGRQVFDAYDAASMGELGAGAAALMPSAIRNATAGLDMLATGKAKDMKGREKTDVTPGESISKAIGFNPTVIAQKNRANMPINQDLAMQRLVESNISDVWAKGIATGDDDMIDKARAKMDDWNRKNPDTPVLITANQIKAKVRQLLTPTDARLLKSAPREMRGRVAAGLDSTN